MLQGRPSWRWLYSQCCWSPSRAFGSSSDAPSFGVGREVMVIGTGQSWGPHKEERRVNSFRSFSTPHRQESFRLSLCPTGVIAAGRVHAGASFLIKGACGTEIPRACLCWGFKCVISAQAPGRQDTLFTLLTPLSVLCLETACAAVNLCAGGRESVGQGELLCSAKIFTCLRNFALGTNNGHAAFSLISCC